MLVKTESLKIDIMKYFILFKQAITYPIACNKQPYLQLTCGTAQDNKTFTEKANMQVILIDISKPHKD